MALDIENSRWLVGAEAAPWLAEFAGQCHPSVACLERVRRALGPSRTHALFEQIELRSRAAEKFPDAGRMFFSRRALEQATDESLARAKAQRFAPGDTVIDACCGIGGDLLSLAERGRVVGVERGAVESRLAAANAAALGRDAAAVVRADAARFCFTEADAWHVDPDRRPGPEKQKRSQLEGYQPGAGAIQRMLDHCPHGSVKMAPAATVPNAWQPRAECQWLGSRGQCRQQMVWFGKLARHAGRHSAMIVRPGGEPARLIVGEPAPPGGLPLASRVGRYVHEPHPALAAARLVHQPARDLGLEFIGDANGYLTSDSPLADEWFQSFEVLDVLPLDIKRLSACLKERRIGRLEIKKRAVEARLDELRRRLPVRGTRSAALIVTRDRQTTLAILAQRFGGASC